jgi:signal transduction histidine kinase/CheY-like chemotaxis protein
VHARGRAERDAEGRPIRLSGALADITEQVQADDERRAMDARLEAAARLESLAVLAGGIAHDFNNLLTGMLGASDAAREDLSDREQVADYLDIVVESAQRAAGLTRQLMAYAGGVPLAMQTVEPEVLVSDLVRLVRGSMPSGATLELVVDPNTPAIRADATQLHQVVMNLLVNAAEAVEPGGIVRVHTTRRVMTAEALEQVHTCYGSAGTYAVLTVDDDGHGMSPQTLRRIFEPFYTTKRGGHGLGLAAVHGMIRAHGGYVDVGSQRGAGTRFEVGLPAIEEAVEPAPTKPKAAPGRTLGHGRSAMVVDDEPVVRRMLRRILESEGFQVYEMPDGEQLDERLRVVDPDLLVLDIILPGRSGLELLAAIRRRGDTRPVLLSSGHADANERLPLPHGDAATRFLPKPYDITALRDHIAALLEPGISEPPSPA